MRDDPEGVPAILASRLRALARDRERPLFVGLDGRSGTGKSTLASATAVLLAAAQPAVGMCVIDGDDFYAGGSAATWDRRSAREKADRVIDWARQRDLLIRLRDSGEGSWFPFDWEATNWDTDEVPLAAHPVEVTAGAIVLLEGAYSCRPELGEQLDLRILLQAPSDVRRARLIAREGQEYWTDWTGRWDSAEHYYFGTVMPPDRFDIVLGSC
jgi:uridine kinase